MDLGVAFVLAVSLMVTATAKASQKEYMPKKLPKVHLSEAVAVQENGGLEVCPLAVTSISQGNNLFQTRSQTFKRTASQHGLFLGQPWNPTKPTDLHDQYGKIFKTGNRNAASHLWVSYILQRSKQLSFKQIHMLMGSFCAVSGSPVAPMGPTRYRAQLTKVGGGKTYGYTYHCCWPCICDTVDFIKTDTKAVVDQSGEKKTYRWLVIGNPCDQATTPPKCKKRGEKGCLPFEAPELVCLGRRLKGAMLSDNGHVIIGPFFDEDPSFTKDDYADLETEADDQGNTLKGACEDRANTGYQSGMGEIFRQVAMINPL